MTAHPILERFARHCAAVMDLAESGQLNRHAALAALVSDALAASLSEDCPPDVADQLLDLACQWAVLRARGLAGDLELIASPVPDDPRDLTDNDTGGRP